MTTREENLKKINNDLEKLDDEQLEQVTGGSFQSTAADSRALQDMGFLIHGRSPSEFNDLSSGGKEKFYEVASEVKTIMGKFGIYVDQYSDNTPSKYYLGGYQPIPDLQY